MVRRSIALVALASAAALSVAGCGSEKKEAPEVAWAGRACGVMTQSSPLPVPKLDNASVLKSKASFVQLLDGISDRMRTLEVKLSGLGAPPVEGGDALLRTTMSNLTRTHSTVTTASRQLAKAKVNDKRSLQQAVGRVGKAFGQYNTYQGPEQDLRKNPKLNAAFGKAPACKK
ncbi:hypothetical protein E1293_37475 [Actinomadura darangshiensis]|uniref:Uncharacterized protein n=1 Tax=Actinomadura darangshiensis TaxID=705336 RepID=A0A4R5A705_9ACTN|nr:hypothetical protein [Actinomadura darangshiensis]TDD67918.1 hypothetical protein E1293_37475 [Actinomadura darangshiensis]